jgi:hypothetical protein
VPALHQAGPGRPPHARGLFRELVLSRARGLCRSRVLRGMGARGACFTSSMSRATLSHRCPIEGCFRFEPRARAARGFCVAWVPAVPALHQAGPGRPSHADIPSRVVFVPSQGSAPLEGSPCLARDPIIKCLAVEAAVLQRGRVFLGAAAARGRVLGGVAGGRDGRRASVPAGLRRDDGPPAVMWPLQPWWGPLVSVKGRFPAVNARGASTPENPPTAYKSKGRRRRRFFTLAPCHFSPPSLRLHLALATARCRH